MSNREHGVGLYSGSDWAPLSHFAVVGGGGIT
jgi:hypothetical protein